MNKKQFRTLGKKLKKVKTWEKGTHKAGAIMSSAGDVAMVAGAVTGQPELVAIGGGLKAGGKATTATSKILKNAR